MNLILIGAAAGFLASGVKGAAVGVLVGALIRGVLAAAVGEDPSK